MFKRWYRSLTRSASLLPPYVILILSLSITGLLTAFALYSAHQESAQRFDRLSRQTVNAITVRMNAYIDTLLHTRGLFLASENVGRVEFQEFVKSLDLTNRYPGIQGIGFTKRLTASELPAFTRRMRAAGFKDFEVWPDSPRNEIFAIAYLEPLDWRNERALGFDMFTEPERHEAMTRARDTGRPAATRKVTLVQETELDPQPGFLIYVPVYDRPESMLKTVQQRRDSLVGFIYSPFRAADLFAKVSDEMGIDERNLDLEIFDGEKIDSSRLFFDSHGDVQEPFLSTAKFSDLERLDVAGTPWTVSIRAQPGFTSPAAISYSWFILLIGLLASFVGYRLSLTNARCNLAMLRNAERLKEEAERKTFLAEALQTLAGTLDYRRSLRELAQSLCGKHADVCAITVIEPGQGPLHFLASATGKFPSSLDLNAPDGIPSVIRASSVQFASNLTTRRPAPENMSLDWLRALDTAGFTSYLCVPLRSRDDAFGALMLASIDPTREFSKSDLEFASDLADRTATAIENSRLYEETKKANRIKDEFLATLSHELRTPLNVIQGHAELLLSETPPGSDLLESIEAIHRNAKSQTQIVNDLLDVSSIITGKISFHPRPTSISEMLERSIASVKVAADAKHIRIHLKIKNRALKVLGDPTRLQQIIWNLLTNAIKFTPSHGDVLVSAEARGTDVLISIKDSGRGVDPAFLPYIFDRFRQEDSSMTRRFGGLGLGLSIVRSLVELHGGYVTAASRGHGHGTKFNVCIPLLLPDPTTDSESERSNQKNKPEALV